MNATELLDNSHLMVIQAVDNLNETEWDVPGACGDWSVKEVIAHLASYEHLLIDILNSFLGEKQKPMPYLERWRSKNTAFRDEEIEKRRYDTAQHILDDYNDIQVEVVSLLAKVPAETLQKKGTVPFYGEEGSLNDVLHGWYKHTREHCDQIEAFRKQKNV